MKSYPIKILIAWGEAISGNEKINKWLYHNGYPELTCVIDFLWGSTKAGDWLVKNKLPQWRAFAEYVGDEKQEARQWLIKSGFDILAITGDAIHNKKGAMDVLKSKNLPEMIILAKKLNKLLYQIEFDTNMIYRSPI